ncbi:hypothetical protein ACFY36_48645 [Actinoplanes sp. NPDC000266]
MAMAEGALWTVQNKRRDSLRRLAWALGMVAAVALGILFVRIDERVLGYVVAGSGAAVLVLIVWWSLWDLTRLAEIRETSDGLLLRTVTGRKRRISPDDVRRVELTSHYMGASPDDDDLDTHIKRRYVTKLMLHLRVSGRLYRGSPMVGIDSAVVDRLAAEWERVCPRATVKQDAVFSTPGTND